MKRATSDSDLISVVHLLHRAGQCADDLFAYNVGTTDLTPRQYAVMRAIVESTEPSQTALVNKTGIDRSTMADIMRRLLAKGLVQRRRTRRDARTYSVRLSEKGHNLLASAGPVVRATDERLLASIPHTHRDTFLKALHRIIQSVKVSETTPAGH